MDLSKLFNRRRENKNEQTTSSEKWKSHRSIGNFKAYSAFSRAFKKSSGSLTKDPVNQKAITKMLMYAHFPEEKPKCSRVVPPKAVGGLVIAFIAKA